MMLWQMFAGTLAVVFGAGLGCALTVALFWLMKEGGTIIENLVAAAHRYAVRNEVVTEYYNEMQKEQVRRFERPIPSRVTVARKAAK